MFFRQLFDSLSSTYSYLLADRASREAVIIDPVIDQLQRDTGLIAELGLTLRYALDTHVHADHVTGASALRLRFGCKTVLGERAGAPCADLLVKEGDTICFGRHALEVYETPGHTAGCVSYVSVGAEPAYAFTGDAVLIRGCGRTDFQEGSAVELYRSVHDKLFRLPPETLICPAHDYKGRTVSSVAEEAEHNPRLGGGRTLQEFAEIMAGLKLDPPKKMTVAVPANLACGGDVQVGTAVPSFDESWAPVAASAAGVPEITPDWLAAHADEVTVLDVRELDEYRAELGHIAHAQLTPLASLGVVAGGLPSELPLVVVCRSGGRSGKAALELARRGFRRVASLRGGMRAWHARGLPVEFGLPRSISSERQG
jgi:sulfur dioxygenase